MTDFEGVLPALGQALTKRGYTVLTPVQNAVLAPELRDADALVSAQTGSGKTVAFGLALAPTLLGDSERFEYAKAPLALAVAPTRELALQVKRELEWLYENTGAKVVSCVGGMDMRMERKNLQSGAHIVVGTPGRLRDHIERGSFDTSNLKGVVLDEADEMLDLGFRDDLEYILDSAPSERRTLMFSATVPRTIATLAKKFQRDAVRVTTAAESDQHVDIDYRALTIAPNDRENAIINVLRYYEAKSAIVFCATRATVNHMTSRFNNRGFSVVALSGELSQNERTHALQAMRDGRARVCIATDVAARGIDLPNLELVIHADIPKSRDPLLHRSGRTGRAGRKGTSVLIVPHNWRKRTERLLASANVSATWAVPPSLDEIASRDHQRILEAPVLAEPLTEDEITFAKELLAKHGAEQIAAAYLRLQRTDQPVPEELIDSVPEEQQRPPRDDFKNGVWFSLSVGRKHNAEPRWLLPTLCRAGHLTKRDIGAIKIQQNETHVELAPECVDRFLEAIGPTRKMEKSITVNRLDGAPAPQREAPPANPYAKKRTFKTKMYAPEPYEGGKSKRSASSDDAERPARARPTFTEKDSPAADAPAFEKKSYEKKAYEKKPYEKKPYEKKPYDKNSSEKKPFEKKPYEKKSTDGAPSADAKPWVKKSKSADDKKSAGKKPYKAKTGSGFGKGTPKPKPGGKGGAKSTFKGGASKPTSHSGAKPGSAPIKRKKLHLKTD